MPDSSDRARAALYGLFIADALAMPVHWYYDRRALQRDYGRVTDYLKPRNPHPDSILWRSSYRPPGSGYDILHEQSMYWGQKGIHYHQFLGAGESTLNTKLCHLLIRSLSACNGYDRDDYLRRYIDFMTSGGNHRDTYVEEYHRHFFNNLAAGKSSDRCGVLEKHIGGLTGMVPILVYYRDAPARAADTARQHLSLTHLGATMETAADVFIDAILRAMAGQPLEEMLETEIAAQRNPFYGHPFRKWLSLDDEEVVGKKLSSACYVQDSVPAVIYLAYKYARDPEKALIANTNLGGDNVHRGTVLGALLGAAHGMSAWPARWIDGLIDPPVAPWLDM